MERIEPGIKTDDGFFPAPKDKGGKVKGRRRVGQHGGDGRARDFQLQRENENRIEDDV